MALSLSLYIYSPPIGGEMCRLGWCGHWMIKQHILKYNHCCYSRLREFHWVLFAVYANNVAIHQLYPNLQLIAYDEWHTLNRYTVSLHWCVCKTPCWDGMHIIHRPLAGLRRVRLSASCHTVYRLHVWPNSLCDVPAPRSARSQPNHW